LSSIKEGVRHDNACELEAGEHEFIVKRSFVSYRQPYKLSNTVIIKCVTGWLYKPKADLDEKVFERVCSGITLSRFTPRWAKTYFSQNS
jgi:hypothetical protein